ncbi:hypothetical protein [Clostridium botulinum]|uniref:hypothetical protein n=1 Tax=Clostridium botulinum TaxID=1491 RepID=UPI0007733AC9|nr:hypothetical protein [Clostridium botulinum]APH21018.1 putative membrane protein [Clostridium botulinum]APQ71241.1 putative membrane protein [Clostridium botulinum]MBN3352140.1 hypothetical protein [Clostridium botulinum]MBN3379219.1 hypothetical protein [Clostridium botulinum]
MNKNKLRVTLTNIFVFIGIASLVIIFWQLLEILIIGTIEIHIIDNIIGTILAISLYHNYQNWIEEDK